MKNRLKEKVHDPAVEALAGLSGNVEKAAVTVGDLQSLMDLPKKLKSTQHSSWDGAAINALQKDVQAIHEALAGVVAQLQRRRLKKDTSFPSDPGAGL